MKKNSLKRLFATVCDTLFVLIWCFVVLFVTLIVSKNIIQNTGEYIINYKLLILVTFSIILFLTLLLKESKKEMNDILEETKLENRKDELK